MTKRVAKKDKGEKTQTATQVAVEGLQELAEVKQYQFTKDAHYRVSHSFYKGELYGSYDGQHDVSLAPGEAMILAFQP